MRQLSLVTLLLLSACRTFIDNGTASPQARSADGTILFVADVTAETLVIKPTVQALLHTKNSTYEMHGSGEGMWTYRLAAPCTASLAYRVSVRGLFLALPLPIPLPTERAYDPPTGTTAVTVTGGPAQVITSPGVIACEAGTDGCTRDVVITNIDPASSLQVTNIAIGSCATCGDFTVGNQDGSGFVLSHTPPLPVTLGCGDSLRVPISAVRAGGYVIQYGSVTITHTRDSSTSSTTLPLEAHVFLF